MRHTIEQIGQWTLILGLWLFFYAIGFTQPALALEATNTRSASLPLPSGEVLLVVDGLINRTNILDEAHLDLKIIQSLSHHSLSTSTSVTDGVKKFDGVLMRDLLNLLSAEGEIVTARALNDYHVDIPISDFHKYDVLLATHMDGKRLLPSGKGPFWIVYPRDKWRQLQDIRYDYRWVWQLHRLTIK